MKPPGPQRASASSSSKSGSSTRGPDHVARLLKDSGLDEPLEPATDEAWARLERMLRVKFPASHRRLLKKFGSGIFGGRLLMLNPSAEQDWRSEFSARWAHGVASLLGGAFPKLNFSLEGDGLVPFAMTRDSVYLCFDRAEAKTSDWSVRVCALHDRWTKDTGLSSPELLAELVSGKGTLPRTIRMRLWRPGEPLFKPAPYLFHH